MVISYFRFFSPHFYFQSPAIGNVHVSSRYEFLNLVSLIFTSQQCLPAGDVACTVIYYTFMNASMDCYGRINKCSLLNRKELSCTQN
jgi:hypothetical protein